MAENDLLADEVIQDIPDDNAPAQDEQVAEKMLPQSLVNKLIHNRTREVSEKAYEKGRKEAMQEFEQQQQAVQQPAMQAPQQQQSVGGVNQMSPDEIKQMIDSAASQKVLEKHQELLEQHSQHRQREDAQRVVNEFIGKMAEGPSKYPDFDQIVGRLKLDQIPDIIRLANQMDNTPGVMRELGINPHKIANIQLLVDHPGLQHLALEAMQKIADSVKNNDAASTNSPAINEPLSNVKPSTVGTDNGVRTVSDLRSDPRYRG